MIDLRTTIEGWHDDSYVDLEVDGLELPIPVIVDRALRGQVVPVDRRSRRVSSCRSATHPNRSTSHAPHGSPAARNDGRCG